MAKTPASSGPKAASPGPPAKAGRVGVVDIGSNTVRLVVYDTPTRLPIPMFNEKARCGLGEGLGKSRKLNKEGVARAMEAMARFVHLAGAMGVERLDVVATSAVREAKDGPAFAAQLEKRFGCRVEVLSGAEEARLAALGLLSGVPDADGLLGDLGGGSLDLVVIDHGAFGQYATTPLGHLRLAEEARGKPKKAQSFIARHLDGLSFIKEIKGRTFYAVGGSWRGLARLFIEQTNYPLHVIDNYTISRGDALKLSRLIAGLGPKSMTRVAGISPRRLENLPLAAMAMEALVEMARPKEVVFSGFGLREGQLLKGLPGGLRDQDPLISGCATLAEHSGRFSISGDEIMEWMGPMFAGETPRERRLRYAACLLADIGWSEHPDYRAEHVFHRVLRLPFAGLSHRDRVLLAEAVFVRYNGDPWARVVAPVRNMLDDEQLSWGRTVGLALRLGHTISGSAPGLLAETSVRLNERKLILGLNGKEELFASEAVKRRLKTLARSMGLKGRIE
ncbi:MAG: Ppx/GppA family phosphatase [Rhodospirillales bacterium]